MATDFFQRQSNARRTTGWLIAMFVLATVGIVATTFIVATVAIAYLQQPQSALTDDAEPFPWELPMFAAAAALALVVGGTLFKVTELRAGGGAGVAERLQGKRLYPDQRGLAERRLLNVVEEMAIASGVPVPPVYLLEESGINAFAAGYSPSDAVVGVTRGAVEQLSREELQGVIAHEFSHILNGDMRISIRLIGILHGILLLGLVGQILFRTAAYSGGGRSRDRGSGVLVIFLIGLALILLGFIGTLIGGMIKAAVSRQREYLADASAVQFTRNPGGIGGALKQIGASVFGSRLKAPGASEASHMFFAQGVWEGFSGLMATHPPLEKRIRAIEPNWDGTFPKVAGPQAADRAAGAVSGAAGFYSSAAGDAVDLALVDHAAEHVAEPHEEHQQYAAEVIASLPEVVRSAAREPYGARAVVYCLLLDPRNEIRQRQVEALRAKADHAVLRLASQLYPHIKVLDPRVRLPLVDLTLPALRSMSAGQYDQFEACVHALIAADKQLGLFEWTLGRIIARHLEPQFRGRRRVPTHYYALGKLGDECSMLLATLAHLGHSPDEAAKAFQAGARRLPDIKLTWLDRDRCSLAQLQDALGTLSSVAETPRGRLIDACAAVICADGHVKQAEAELLRGIADLLDCPVPPLIAGQPVEPAAAFAAEGART